MASHMLASMLDRVCTLLGFELLLLSLTTFSRWTVWYLAVERLCVVFFFSSRRRHTRFDCDWSSDVCSSDLSSERRRGRRMNSRVPVRLEWDEASGKRSSAEAHTRIINPYGCMVVLPHPLGLDRKSVV